MNKNLQPKNKSFGYYVLQGYLLHKKEISKEIKEAFNKLSLIDDYILILDDIYDDSKERNGKTCLHILKGKKEAIEIANKYKREFLYPLDKIFSLNNTSKKYRIKTSKKIKKLLKNISYGEKIDKKLQTSIISLIKKEKMYFKMIKFFTGEHVKIGMEVGQLINNCKPDKKISKSAVLFGEIRQIIDDYEDYFPKHHEPFGDFIHEKNRLPEIIFKRKNGKREEILKLIKEKDFEKARKNVLTTSVKNELQNYCNKLFKKIEKINANFNFSQLVKELGAIK